MPPQNHLDDLTAREREVLDLVRVGLTNEEIAGRLGITEAGVKYHVSQILSKLGVTTREEAAAVSPHVAEAFQPRRSRWWAALPLAAKAAGVAVMLAAVAGLALLAWGVFRTSGDDAPDGGVLTVDEVFAGVLETMNRQGQVLHTTVTMPERTTDDGESVIPTEEMWFDVTDDTARTHLRTVTEGQADEGEQIYAGPYYYAPDDPGEALRIDFEQHCQGSDSTVLAVLLRCGLPGSLTVDNSAEFEGRLTVALVISGGYERSSPGPGQPSSVEYQYITYLEPQTLLPIAQTYPFQLAAEGQEAYSRYEHEFIPRDDLAVDFFDPRSLGYGTPDAAATLNALAAELPVYWIGEEVDLGSGAGCFGPHGCPLVLVSAISGSLNEAVGRLYYESPSGVSGIGINMWRPEDWASFVNSPGAAILTDPECTELRHSETNGRPVTLYITCDRRLLTDTLVSGGTLLAAVDYGDVVIEVRVSSPGPYGQVETVDAVVDTLEPYQP